MNKGFVYIIDGTKYSRWALRSVLSLRSFGGESSNLPVIVYFLNDYCFVDQFNELSCVCIKLPPADKKSIRKQHRMAKAIVMGIVPFEKYIMIDADTFVQGDPSEMFDLIPDDGIAGIEDGNFQSHLQMARFLFVKSGVADVRDFVIHCLGVDYGDETQKFPPYYNVGVFGLSQAASQCLSKHMQPLFEKLHSSLYYNPHDEQLPINSIMHKNSITGVAINPIFNYTKSRLKKNLSNKTHDDIKDSVRVIHNRKCVESDWIKEKAGAINQQLEKILSK